MRLTPKESEIQKLITDYLDAERIWWMRINAGAFAGEHNGKKRFHWFVRRTGGKTSGHADILARVRAIIHGESYGTQNLWIEVKKSGEEQTPAQKEFEQEVIADGQYYIVVSTFESFLFALNGISKVEYRA